MPDLLLAPTPHSEAAALIRGKPAVHRAVFDQMLPEIRGRAFTITGVEHATALQNARELLATLPEGADWDQVENGLVNEISPYMIDPDADPEIRDKQLRAATRRAELLLRTHGFQAYQATSWQVMDRQRAAFPYWQYWTMGDARVRPEHAALNGIVLPQDDPFWDDHFPPWDWGCRCQVVPLSQAGYEEEMERDADRAPDRKLVLGEAQKDLLKSGQLIRDGRSYVVSSPAARGKEGAFSWHPSRLQIPLDELRARYDAPTWERFERFARNTFIEDAGLSLWEWLLAARLRDEERARALRRARAAAVGAPLAAPRASTSDA